MIFRLRGGTRRQPGVLVVAALVVLLLSACGLPGSRGGGSPSAGSEKLSAAAGKNVAAKSWIGHLVSWVAVDPTTIGKAETGFALQADQSELAYGQSLGTPENQYQPTGEVTWVAIPPKAPTLFEVARIETTWRLDPGSSQPSKPSEDTLALLTRKSTHAQWMIADWVGLENLSQNVVDQVRTLGDPLTSASAAKLPVSPQNLPSAYLDYLNGGDSSKFAPGPFTDQERNSFQSEKARWAATASESYKLTQGSVGGVYSVQGGDALVFFGFMYDTVFQAGPSTCISQGPATPNFSALVPNGKYQSVSIQGATSLLGIEDPKSGTVSIVAGEQYLPVKATTTPATAPACL